jgi:hypothetical protein
MGEFAAIKAESIPTKLNIIKSVTILGSGMSKLSNR